MAVLLLLASTRCAATTAAARGEGEKLHAALQDPRIAVISVGPSAVSLSSWATFDTITIDRDVTITGWCPLSRQKVRRTLLHAALRRAHIMVHRMSSTRISAYAPTCVAHTQLARAAPYADP